MGEGGGWFIFFQKSTVYALGLPGAEEYFFKSLSLIKSLLKLNFLTNKI